MALQSYTFKFSDEEIKYMDDLCFAERLDRTNLIRQAVKEFGLSRGKTIPEGAFTKKQEGRPKENPPLATAISC